MSDGSLSQDEIDALLQGTGGMDFDTGPADVTVNDNQLDEFRRLIEGTVSSQQSNLSMLVSNEVALSATSVEVVKSEHVPGSLPQSRVTITINLTEGSTSRSRRTSTTSPRSPDPRWGRMELTWMKQR